MSRKTSATNNPDDRAAEHAEFVRLFSRIQLLGERQQNKALALIAAFIDGTDGKLTTDEAAAFEAVQPRKGKPVDDKSLEAWLEGAGYLAGDALGSRALIHFPRLRALAKA
jgi:hypothetical protein